MAELILGTTIKTIIPLIIKGIKSAKKRNEKKKAKGKIPFEDEQKILYNLSGHPLNTKTKEIFLKWNYHIIDIPIPNTELTYEGLLNSAKEIILKCGDEATNQLLTGNFVVIPCGMSGLWSILVAMFHGISGQFPNIIQLSRVESMFIPLLPPLDLQVVRNEFRTIRF